MIEKDNFFELKKRFVNDCNLPIQILYNPYFEERLKMCSKEYKAEEKWNSLIKIIDERYGGNPQLFLNNYYYVRETIIQGILNRTEYKEFLEDDMTKYEIKKQYSERNIYNEAMDKKIILSVDLSKANFQALKYHNPGILFYADSYSDFINLFTTLDYIKESKYTRQVIFGKLNPKRTIKIEKYICSLIDDYLFENGYIGSLDGNLTSLTTDELLYEISLNNYNPTDICGDIIKGIKEEIGVDVKADIFKVSPIKFEIPMSHGILTIFKKTSLCDKTVKYKDMPMTYFPQIYKLLNNMEITENDMAFMYEGQVAKFLEPLKLLK